MNKISTFILFVCLVGLFIPLNGQGTVKDIDGNSYKTMQIGSQVWMTENIRTTRFRNGDLVPNIKDPGEWKVLTSAGSCDLSNNPENTKKMGKLYNWFVAADERGICPSGWHVPSDQEWQSLTIHLTGENGHGSVLPEMADLNREIFNLLPQEFRGYDGEYSHIGYGGGGWWSSTPVADQTGYYRGVTYNTAGKQRMEGLKYFGYHIRCVKD